MVENDFYLSVRPISLRHTINVSRLIKLETWKFLLCIFYFHTREHWRSLYRCGYLTKSSLQQKVEMIKCDKKKRFRYVSVERGQVVIGVKLSGSINYFVISTVYHLAFPIAYGNLV